VRDLFEAIRAGELGRVVALLKRAPGLLGARDEEGRSPLLVSLMSEQGAIADHLRSRGHGLDLVEAILSSEKDLVRRLALAQAETINDDHPVGGTAYYAAARYGHYWAIWPLNRHGGDPNANPRGPAGVTALRAAFDATPAPLAKKIALRILDDAGDPSRPQRNGDSVLHAAARLGDPALVRVIIRKGGWTDKPNARGEAPIDLARRGGSTETLAVLTSAQAIPRDHSSTRRARRRDGDRYRASEGAVPQLVINEFVEVCHYDFEALRRIAREHPTVIHGEASWQEIGVEACAHMAKPDWTDHLLDLGSPMSLPTALMMGELDAAKELLDARPERIRERGPHDFALFWYPQIGGGNVAAAELLLERGIDIHEEKYGVTLLHRASNAGQIELVAFLLERGADPNRVGRSDFSDLEGTCLDFALAAERGKVTALLREHGGTSLGAVAAGPRASPRDRAGTRDSDSPLTGSSVS
jgi:cytohesin